MSTKCMFPARVAARVSFALAAVAAAVPARAALEIVDTEAWPDSTVKVVFRDTAPPLPYTVERKDASNPDSPWQPLGWQVLACTQPALFEAYIPGAAQQQGFYRVAVAAGTGLPLVIATDPANGATGVDPALTAVRVTFDRPMAATAGLSPDANWGASAVTWSADMRTAEIRRLNAATALPVLGGVRLTLNPNGRGFADTSGRKLPPFMLAFTTGSSAVSGPHVVRSIPANGATGVDPMLDTVELHFSEPMLPTGGFSSMNWYPWTMTWSADRYIAYVKRGTSGKPLYATSVSLSPLMFQSAASVPLTAPFTLQFKTGEPPAQRIAADPAKGFSWPYYLMVPQVVTAPGTLLVETNNTGSSNDDPWVHEEAALSLLGWRSSFATDIGCPLLVPVFPRPMNPPAPEPGGIYVHALDRYSLSSQWAGIERVDLQLLAMIDDALQRLRAMGHAMDDKVFIMGFSASGAFSSRFTILHPERVKAAAPGSPGGWPTAPAGSWQGTTLRYPMGVQDVQTLAGQPFNLAAFRQVALYIYVGTSDTNDAFDVRGMTSEEKTAVHQFLNYPADPLLASRWPLAKAIYDSVGANAIFVTYPGVGHTISTQMFADLAAFFRSRR